MTALRIGLITGEYPPMRGGIATQVKLLATKLADTGHRPYVLTSTGGYEPTPNVETSPILKKWGFALPRHLNHWIKRNELQVVNLHYQTAAYDMSPMVHFIQHMVSVPLITTFHDLRFPYLFPKAGPLRPWIVNHLAASSQAVVSTNQEDAARLIELNLHHTLIPIGSNISPRNTQKRDPAPDASIGSTDTFLVAFFGFVNHSKGLDVLLHAIAALRDKAIKVQLLMIGDQLGSSDKTNSVYAGQLNAEITRLNLHDHISWTGFVSDSEVQKLMTTADVVAMPFRDGASYRRSSLISAIESKCAIVTTAPVVSVPTFINGENMLIVPSDDVPALTSALEHLYNNPALREHLREGTTILSKTFSWDQIVASYTNLYREVIESNA